MAIIIWLHKKFETSEVSRTPPGFFLCPLPLWSNLFFGKIFEFFLDYLKQTFFTLTEILEGFLKLIDQLNRHTSSNSWPGQNSVISPWGAVGRQLKTKWLKPCFSKTPWWISRDCFFDFFVFWVVYHESHRFKALPSRHISHIYFLFKDSLFLFILWTFGLSSFFIRLSEEKIENLKKKPVSDLVFFHAFWRKKNNFIKFLIRVPNLDSQVLKSCSWNYCNRFSYKWSNLISKLMFLQENNFSELAQSWERPGEFDEEGVNRK